MSKQATMSHHVANVVTSRL